MHTSACFKIVNKCKISKFARLEFKNFSRIFKYFQAPYLFSSTFKGLEVFIPHSSIFKVFLKHAMNPVLNYHKYSWHDAVVRTWVDTCGDLCRGQGSRRGMPPATSQRTYRISSDSCYRDTQTHNSENSAPHRFACSNKPLMYKMTSHTVSCQTEGTCTNRRYMEVFTV